MVRLYFGERFSSLARTQDAGALAVRQGRGRRQGRKGPSKYEHDLPDRTLGRHGCRGLIAWNVNHIARGNGGTRLPTVAIGEAWSELWHLLTGVGAHGSDIHVTKSVDDALAWLLDQPEIR